MRSLPDFLGIGAPRAGTTWLHDVLSRHSGVFMPPVKEVHYFDVCDPNVDRRSFRYRHHLVSRMASSAAHFVPSLAKHLGSEQSEWAPIWDWRYFVGRSSDSWYFRLFSRAAESGQVCGEITPSYSLLSPSGIDHVLNVNPDIKLIYVLRDPIERAWSHAVKVLSKETNVPLERVPHEAFLKFYESEENVRVGSYAQNISRYLEKVRREQLLVIFFDDIADQPDAVIERIFRFLGCENAGSLGADLERKVNSSARGRPVPSDHELVLANLYKDDLARLAREYGSWSVKWYERVQRLAIT